MQRRLDETGADPDTSSIQFDFSKDSSLETQAYKGQLFWSIVLLMVVFAFQGLMIVGFKMAKWEIPGSICFPQLQVFRSTYTCSSLVKTFDVRIFT